MNLTLAHLNDEAVPIARLVGHDSIQTVGWVYVWETSELAILWIGPSEMAAFIEPRINQEVLTTAKAMTPDEVVILLSELPMLPEPSSG